MPGRPFRIPLGLAITSGLLGGPALVAAALTAADAPADRQWMSHGGGYDEAGFGADAQIDGRTVPRLGLAWSLDLPGEVSLEATPLEVGGTIYFTGSQGDVYAVDAVTGALRWKHMVEVWKHNPDKMRIIFGANRGAAFFEGKVFSATMDGRLLALDAASGKLLWSVQTVDRDSVQIVTGAPRAFEGLVLIGNSGGDLGIRGYVTAYDARTGQQRWRFYTVPTEPARERGDPAMALAATTWRGEWWKVSGGGGTVWDGMTFDPELGRVYLGVGNSGPYNPAVRSPGGGDNLFLASIVALDAKTGAYIWHYQVNPREAWDYKATQNMIAATLTIDGKGRKVLMQSPTNGFFYVIDRLTGRLISAEKTGKVTWADSVDRATGRPAERPDIRYEKGAFTMWPSPMGTHNWQAMSFSAQTGLVYIPYMQVGARFDLQEGALLGGVTIEPVKADAEDGTGALLAWDPLAQKARWKVPHASFWNGGTLATAGGLVFQGTGDGEFAAYDGATGKKLWRFDAGLGIIGAPISYSVRGRQFISLLVGFGGATGIWSNIAARGWKYGAQPRRLLTFALDGRANLPATAPQDFTVHPVDDPATVLDPARVKAGAGTYALRCVLCHGGGLKSGGVAPDLRESQAALDPDAFNAVVRGGVLMQAGMPRFQDLSDEEMSDLRSYVRSGARAALRGRDADDEKGAHF